MAQSVNIYSGKEKKKPKHKWSFWSDTPIYKIIKWYVEPDPFHLQNFTFFKNKKYKSDKAKDGWLELSNLQHPYLSSLVFSTICGILFSPLRSRSDCCFSSLRSLFCAIHSQLHNFITADFVAEVPIVVCQQDLWVVHAAFVNCWDKKKSSIKFCMRKQQGTFS